ncbi:glutamate ligase domain-containing protein [Kitasatospora sp. NPDC098663]|uniref:glutamate ligase domain-containing protein n=1 Tax=Kitasatospora sp. NPDC098663 TaxID=3364096 RepID=UPI00382CD083
MEGLALWLASRGLEVTASTGPAEQDGRAAARLREAGVSVSVGFDAGHVREDCSCVVWSGAATGPHPELDRARAVGLPVLIRALALSVLAGEYGGPVAAVYGSHGTATAAAALAAVLDDGRTSWILNAAPVGATAGQGRLGRRLVVDLSPDAATHEAARGHLPNAPQPLRRPSPTVTLITTAAANVPHFEDPIEALNAATTLARASATVVLPLWDKGATIVHERLTDRPGPRVVTVGTDPHCTVWIMSLSWTGWDFRVALRYDGMDCGFVVPVQGRHHALAVCAALATALVLGEERQELIDRATEFRGVRRSLTTLGTQRGVTVVDSRARHPREIAQDVTAARLLTEGSVVVALEPDGIARTSAHSNELGAALADADHVLLLPVSTPLATHDGPDPLDAVERAAVRALGPGAVHRTGSGPCEPGPEQRLAEIATEGDLVLVVGTGAAVQRLGPRLLDHLAQATGRP